MFSALLDTSVLWPRLQRDFLLSLAAEGSLGLGTQLVRHRAEDPVRWPQARGDRVLRLEEVAKTLANTKVLCCRLDQGYVASSNGSYRQVGQAVTVVILRSKSLVHERPWSDRMVLDRQRSLDHCEERIRAYLERHLSVPVEQHDDGTCDGMYDLTIKRPSGDEAVEIVSDASPEMRSSMKARMKLPDQIPCPGLKSGWRVRPRNNVKVKGFVDGIEKALRALECGGAYDMSFADESAWAAAVDAGLDFAQRDARLGAGEVRIISAIVTGGSVGVVDEVAALATEVLGRSPDVSSKLSASGLSVTHVVIAVTGDEFRRSAIFGLVSSELPRHEPSVPDPIDHVWLLPDQPDARVLRWCRRSGWHDEGRTPT